MIMSKERYDSLQFRIFCNLRVCGGDGEFVIAIHLTLSVPCILWAYIVHTTHAATDCVFYAPTTNTIPVSEYLLFSIVEWAPIK